MANWTENELAILKNAELTHNDVVERTGRSYSAVKLKRLELGVKQKTEYDYWSTEEIKCLIKNRNLSNREIAELLDRTAQAVSLKRQRLNLHQFDTSKWDAEEEEYLIMNYNGMGNKQIADYLGRTVSAIQSKAYELGISKKQDYWTKKEVSLLKNNIDLPIEELTEIINSKTTRQIAYKKTYIRTMEKRDRKKENFDIQDDHAINIKGKLAGYIDILSVLDIGESFEFPLSEVHTLNAAKNHLPEKIFRVEKTDQTTGRAFRLS